MQKASGQKALKWKIKYIEAFNKMEAQLKSKPATIAQQILAQAQMLVDMEKKVAEHEEAITDTKICKQEDLPIGSVVDSKYGYINTYPQDVLDRVFF